jgi:hypothetical protein
MTHQSLARTFFAAAIAATALAHAGDQVDRRDIQIKSVDFESGVLEVHNYGSVGQVLVGWRFCTHDSDQVRRYTSSTGLNMSSVDAGESLFIYTNNDAPAGAQNINVSALGGSFALPLDPDAYGLQLFFPSTSGTVSFSNSALIADHIQWNTSATSAGSAEARTSQAVSEGLWTSTGVFIETASDSTSLELTDEGDGRLHGPANYTVSTPNACPADLDNSGSLNFGDVSAFLTLYGNGDLAADLDNSGSLNFGDVTTFLTLYAQGCP